MELLLEWLIYYFIYLSWSKQMQLSEGEVDTVSCIVDSCFQKSDIVVMLSLLSSYWSLLMLF